MWRIFPHKDGYAVWIVLAVSLAAAFLCRRMARRERKVSAGRKQLLWAAYGRYILSMLGLMALLCLPVFAAWFAGRMGAGGLLGGCCIMLAMVGFVAWGWIREVRSGTRLLFQKEVDVDTLLHGAELVRRGSILSYVDKDWYICLGGKHVIMLYAPLINFDRAVEEVRLHTGTKLSLRDRLRFRGHEGYYDAICTPNHALNTWIAQHGGGYDQRILEKRRNKREVQKKRALRGRKGEKPAD